MKHLLLTLLLAAQCATAAVLDDMKDATPWKAAASDQVKASLRRDAKDDSLCLDYDFAGVSGYAVLRRELPLDWPADFALTTPLKGRGAGNDVQIKLVDASGDNVWWINRPAFDLPDTLTEQRFKRRHVTVDAIHSAAMSRAAGAQPSNAAFSAIAGARRTRISSSVRSAVSVMGLI